VVWLVGHDGQVDVWMALERCERLFVALMEHLSHDVADTYQSIKDKIRDAITEATKSQAPRISVTGLPSQPHCAVLTESSLASLPPWTGIKTTNKRQAR
jgi:hypothetical protein